MNYYHVLYCHINYKRLVNQIITDGFYFKNIYRKAEKFCKECEICITNKCIVFKKPANNPIISNSPLEKIQLDITYLPKELIPNDSKAKYLLTIIDHFSKYGEVYILEAKNGDIVLGQLKNFINKIGKPAEIQTDNGPEFTNNKFKNYCNENDILFITSRPLHL